MSKQDKQARNETSPKKEYEQPELTVWGSVTELTTAGLTNPGGDSMCGSIEQAQGPPGECEA